MTQGWVQSYRQLREIGFLTLRLPATRDAAWSTLELVVKAPSWMQLLRVTPRESYVEIEYQRVDSDLLLNHLRVISREQDPNPPHLGKKDRVDSPKGFQSRMVSIQRDAILRGVRAYFWAKGFVECNFQTLLPGAAEGGAQVFRLDGDLRGLAQSPQLEKQRMVNYGLHRVYGIANAYRAQKFKTTRHRQEFTMIDFEMNTGSLMQVMEICKGVIMAAGDAVGQRIQSTDFNTITHAEATGILGVQTLTREGELELFRHHGEPYLIITGYPDRERPFYAAPGMGFDILHRRMELVSGGLRQGHRHHLQDRLRQRGMNPVDFESYLASFTHGNPCTGGAGIGLDRLMMVLLDLPSISKTVPYWIDADCEDRTHPSPASREHSATELNRP